MEPDPKPDDGENKAAKRPPPLRKDTVLDSVFRESGPMPAAGLGIRGLAFLLDFALVFAIVVFLVVKVALPREHPTAGELWADYQEEVSEWLAASERPDFSAMPEPSPALESAVILAYEVNFFAFWIYFAIGEALFGGVTLGKRACRLRAVSTVTLDRPTALFGMLRGGLKTAALFVYPPFTALLTIGGLFLNKRRQMGHDMLSRTAVIDETKLSAEPEKNIR